MVKRQVTVNGQVSLPAELRRRWRARAVIFEDLGDRAIVRPAPDDAISAARGALKPKLSSAELRAMARRDEARAEARRR